MNKSIFIKGAEYFRIENGNYYMSDENDICLVKVSKEEFEKELKKM